MTDKKKIDEAASLRVSHNNGGMSVEATYAANDLNDLASLLKRAGIAGDSRSINGSATLTIDSTDESGATMNSVISSPDLRSIMTLLEPEFQAVGDQEAALDDLGAESDDDHIVDPAPVAVEEPVDMGDDLSEFVDHGKWVNDDGLLSRFTREEEEEIEEVLFRTEIDNMVDALNSTISKMGKKFRIADSDFRNNQIVWKLVSANVNEETLNENSEDFVYEYMENKPVGSQGCEEEDNGYGGIALIAWTTVTPEMFAELGEDGAAEDAHDICVDLAGDTTGFDDHLAQFMPNDYGSESGMDLTKPAIYFVAWIKEAVEESTEYAGIADRKPVQPRTKMVPAKSADNPLAEGPFDDKPGQFPDTEQGAIDFMKSMSSHDMEGATATPDSHVEGVWKVNHKTGSSIVYLNDMDFEDLDETAPAPKSFKDYVREVQLGELSRGTVKNYVKKVNSKDYDNADELELEKRGRGLKNAQSKIHWKDAKVIASEEVTAESLLDEFTNAAAAIKNEAVDDRFVVASRAYEPFGFVVIDTQEDEWQNEVSEIFPTREMAQAEAEVMNGRPHPQDELEEAGRNTDWQAKARQYGEPFYLNTDCGYSSLEDIMSGWGYFDGIIGGLASHSTKEGFTVLEIDRNGKKGYNYVTSPTTNLTPGSPVTCITQTSTGQKFRPGKFIASFNTRELSLDYDNVVAELAKLGITPSKKLPVKTFD